MNLLLAWPLYTPDTIWPQFKEEQIAGLFTPTHFIVLAAYALLLAVALFLSRKLTEKGVRRATVIVGALSTVCYILKSFYRSFLRDLGGMLPIYVSDLYIFASWFTLSKNKHIKRLGECFISFGSTTAGIAYILFPTTSLLVFPVWHPISIHGILYHWAILYIGILTLWKVYRPKASDFWYFFSFMTFFTAIALVLNNALPELGLNFMFVSLPIAIPILDWVYAASPVLYTIVVYLAQTVALYWVWYGGCVLARKRKETRIGGEAGLRAE